MTSLQPSPLRLTHLDTRDTVRIDLHGDLDHYWADALLVAVTRTLAENTGLHHLFLHCQGLAAVDSSGLSALLMVRRLTGAAGVHLHIEERPLRLERLLELTGTLDYLTAPETGTPNVSSASRQRAAAASAEESIAARPGSTDSNP
ncbi:STAS domain-containing protein [Streptomyces sp. NPDC006544]|uniref:STAS domain-containing protein n=1 Tax=Streptomyces sp. NPDC006544 TaxID=3154583 RepID=UPI0033B72A8B